ncbi:MAG TPA: DUF4870 domain-containing protein [Tepidisphaeraceae bacterium]|jgi:hypothetical protein
MTDMPNNSADNAAPPPPPMSYAAVELEPNPDARLWGMLCHLFGLAGFVIPFGNIIGPLVAWLIKKDQYPFVDDQGKEAINFHITMAIALVCAALLMFVVIGFFLLPILALIGLIFSIIGGLEANKGRRYRYPFAIRLIK